MHLASLARPYLAWGFPLSLCLPGACLTASRSLCKLENADGAAGSEYSLRNKAI